MKCPICAKLLCAPNHAFLNAETYQKSVVVVTECCNMPIVIQPRISFVVRPYVGSNTSDDWGTPITNKKNNNEKI